MTNHPASFRDPNGYIFSWIATNLFIALVLAFYLSIYTKRSMPSNFSTEDVVEQVFTQKNSVAG